MCDNSLIHHSVFYLQNQYFYIEESKLLYKKSKGGARTIEAWLGETIKKHLEERGISQAYISEKAQISPAKFNLALNGKRKFTLTEYAAICYVLKVDTNYFLKPRLPDRKEEGRDGEK